MTRGHVKTNNLDKNATGNVVLVSRFEPSRCFTCIESRSRSSGNPNKLSGVSARRTSPDWPGIGHKMPSPVLLPHVELFHQVAVELLVAVIAGDRRPLDTD